eukprot:CAMPEP_0206039790 /NCGR_PEP_ID=MMETSP1466-20131121/4980_1 /ASSEMBLY_ACC=CAM_ASM_001126 /TAXON_ID=44452 /ORGANISM="Pavlova gyrans, Strain CCMP608" /LENGTH=98 /DNA_ID=CAMNT_0053414443 /DNA_START=233 /DNA_END=526 /DNA_ORIENTATION=+
MWPILSFTRSTCTTTTAPSERYALRSPSRGNTKPGGCPAELAWRRDRLTRDEGFRTFRRSLFAAAAQTAAAVGSTTTTASTVHLGHLPSIIPELPTRL